MVNPRTDDHAAALGNILADISTHSTDFDELELDRIAGAARLIMLQCNKYLKRRGYL
jgi:hypothetical protein